MDMYVSGHNGDPFDVWATDLQEAILEQFFVQTAGLFGSLRVTQVGQSHLCLF